MNGKSNEWGYLLAVRTAAVAGVLAIVVCALLLYDYSQRRGKDPLDSPVLQALQMAIDEKPTNEALKVQYREWDVEMRRQYFRHRMFAGAGVGLLLVSVMVFLWAAKTATTLRRRMPQPGAAAVVEDREAEWTAVARWTVGGVCAVLVGVAAVLIVGSRSDFQQSQEEPVGDVLAALPASPRAAAGASEAGPTEEEVAQAWPRFRGPGGLGISAYTNVPETWDAESGKGILWKSPVPLPGNSSPVVWGKHVFLSGADEKQREVYAFDAQSGKLLWRQAAPGTPQSTVRPPKVEDATGYASPTVASDGRRVFAIFANGDLAAFDFAGKLAWSKSLGIPENSYGHASSLEMFRNLLLVQLDQGSAGDVKLLRGNQRSAAAPKSKLFAFDAATGKIVWQVGRPVPSSWTTPIVIRSAGRDQVVTAADPWVIAYDPANGSELWRVKCLNIDTGTSPTFADGKVYVANETAVLAAIAADGNGDMTDKGILWKGDDGLPDTCSPLATKEFVFLLSAGRLTCYDAVKGGVLWTEDFDGTFCASPSLAGNRLYVIGTAGKAWIVEPTREKCRRIAEANVGEECFASPAFQDGRIYLRGKNNLFCIGNQ